MNISEPSPWKDYFAHTKGKPPRPLLVEAIALVKDKENALDLGSGALNDSMYLLSAGYKHVTAVDKVSIAEDIAKTLPIDTFKYVISTV